MSDLVLHEKWELTPTGLNLRDPDMEYAEFEHLCYVLGKLHSAVRFAIGDAIIQGEALYGETAFQAFSAFQLSEEAMRDYVRVALRVPRSRRRKTLSWSHHRAVAALEPAEQKERLRQAVDEGLSHHQLRDVLRNGRVTVDRERCESCGRAF